MMWLVFSYSLPSRGVSSARVGCWRRLQQLGTVAVKNGLHVLPDRDDCGEAFHWLAQQVQESKGEATVMRVERFEGVTATQLIDLFHAQCRQKYQHLDQQIESLGKRLRAPTHAKKLTVMTRLFQKLQRQCDDIARIDYFVSPYGLEVASHLRQLKQAFSPNKPAKPLPAVAPAIYHDRTWVTRPRPHVDRLACVWLIRRWINPKAIIRYSTQPTEHEVRFDMPGAEFGHHGACCTFETMMLRFGLSDDPALQAVAEIVHEIDLRDGLYARPEASGIDAVLKGWLLDKLPDQELETHGVALFQALYVALARTIRPKMGTLR
jgi:hypothetical protein